MPGPFIGIKRALLGGGHRAIAATDSTANDREFIVAGEFFSAFVCETGTRSMILPAVAYLTETS